MVLLLVSVGRKAFTRRTVEKAPEDHPLSESEDLSSHPNETAGAQAPDEQPETAPASSKTTRAFAQTSEREPRLEDRIAAIEHAEPLSARELEVLDLILRGNTVAAVSRKLFISENTVRGHTKHIYRKLSVHSKQELIDLLN
jgi:DNA-binding CsgD family transcriptional regulator